jgi:PhzF family phenazine biosynthesis protein
MSTNTPIFQVDAFTDSAFAGNPAAVCLLESVAHAEWMQSVAAEMNLSETAFVRRLDEDFGLRWFTPVLEVDLCGHATLATAHVLWQEGWLAATDTARFHTRSGVLTARRAGDSIVLDFPATPAAVAEAPQHLLPALGVSAGEVLFNGTDYLVAIDDERELRELQPDFPALKALPVRGVIVTAVSRQSGFDFISRFFGPAAGIDEDPVTGSAHCTLGPYWGERLNKTELHACQASARGGEILVGVHGDRVSLAGKAVTVLAGRLLP